MPKRRVVDQPDPKFPDRWKGGSQDFGFIRTFEGHIGWNAFDYPSYEDGWDRTNPLHPDDE